MNLSKATDILIIKYLKSAKYLPYFISEQMGLINQKYKLVEIYINGESRGLFIEQEKNR